MVVKNANNRYGLGLAANSVEGLRGALRRVFGFAVAEGLIEDNPVKGTKIPPPPLSSANPLTLEEAWSFVSTECDSRYRDAFVFNLHTGLRPEELMALIRDDVDFAKGNLRIERASIWIDEKFHEFGPTKSRRSDRIIELAPEHMEFLREMFEKQDRHIAAQEAAGLKYGEPKILEWLKRTRPNQKHLYSDLRLIFPNQFGCVPPSTTARRSFKYMLRQTGFSGDRLRVRWYDLRHTHATFLLIMGVPEHEVAARMGHTVDTLRRYYTHVLPERQRKASSIFANLVPLNSGTKLSLEDTRKRIQDSMNTSAEEVEGALSYLLRHKPYKL